MFELRKRAIPEAFSEDQKRKYHKRSHIEAVCSFVKTQYSLVINKVKG
jgi:hypothetical protein